MERTKGEGMVEKTRWKKVGGGSLRLGNRIIKPGEIFTAYKDDIPKGFRDLVIALDTNVVWEEKKQNPVITPADVVKPIYSVQYHGGSKTWYDVVSQTGVDEKGEPILKILNEKGMKKEAAEKLIEDLQK